MLTKVELCLARRNWVNGNEGLRLFYWAKFCLRIVELAYRGEQLQFDRVL